MKHLIILFVLIPTLFNSKTYGVNLIPDVLVIGLFGGNTYFRSGDRFLCIQDSSSDASKEKTIDEGCKVLINEDGEEEYGQETYNQNYFPISLEYRPKYIFGRLGYNTIILYRNIDTTIINYPNQNEKLSLELSTLSISPTAFITIGDKNLDDGLSLRFGFGLSFNIINNFKVNNERVNQNYILGESFLGELRYSSFFFRSYNTNYNINIPENINKGDKIHLSNNDNVIGYSFYF